MQLLNDPAGDRPGNGPMWHSDWCTVLFMIRLDKDFRKNMSYISRIIF